MTDKALGLRPVGPRQAASLEAATLASPRSPAASGPALAGQGESFSETPSGGVTLGGQAKAMKKSQAMEFSFGQTDLALGKKGTGRFLAQVGVEPGLEFEEKFTVHAGTMGQTKSGEPALALYGELIGALGQGPLGLYLHLPFCQNRCLYCGFVGRKPDDQLIEKYIGAVRAEIEFLATLGLEKLGPVRTVYFGGGTPTIVAPKLLATLTGAIQKTFSLATDYEMTLEGRVSDLSPEKVSGFLEAGFNRFSLGVQSFDTKIRRSLGRHSHREKTLAKLTNLIQRGAAPVIIDLIYGLPGQEVADFLDDLATADKIGLDGLDTYQLNVFSGGELEKAVRENKIAAPAKLSQQAEFYIKAAEYLDSLKWRRLSLSHYARDTRERNIYNPWAKKRQNCLAFGAGAGGFINGHATYKKPDVLAYLETAQKGQFGPDFLTLPTGRESLNAFIVGQMELGYLNLKKLFEDQGVKSEAISVLTENWQKAGLIKFNGDHMELTDSGRFWGVNLTQALVVTASGETAKP